MTTWCPPGIGTSELRILLAEAEENTGTIEQRANIISQRAQQAIDIAEERAQ